MNRGSLKHAPCTLSGRPARAVQRGVGLIEVMIAVLILSIGFLGMGALMSRSLSTNNSAMMRSLATIDSYSILEAMRLDRNTASAGTYNKTMTASATCSDTTAGLVGPQLTTWCRQLYNDLGKSSSTTGTINCLSSGYCTITVQFDDSRAGIGGTSTQKVITEAVL